MSVHDRMSGRIRLVWVNGQNLQPPDRRTKPRFRSYLSGRILFNLGRSAMSVRIRDLSADGTKVLLGIPWPCPQRFTLEIDRARPALSETRECEVVWQHGMTIGVRFIDRKSRPAGRSIQGS